MILPLLLAAALVAAPPSTERLPPANPIPLQSADEAAIMAPVNAVLRAIGSDDGTAVLANARPEGGLTAAFDLDGKRTVRRLSWAEFAASLKPGGDRYEERIFDPAIEADGDVGFVWARFTVLKNGQPHHCGYDLFDLVREDGRWKVLNITWSQRTDGCTAE